MQNDIELTQNDILHYGVKGMQWGVVNEEEPTGKRPQAKEEKPQNDQNQQTEEEQQKHANTLEEQEAARRVMEEERAAAKKKARRIAGWVIAGVATTAIIAKAVSNRRSRAQEAADNMARKKDTEIEGLKNTVSELKGRINSLQKPNAPVAQTPEPKMREPATSLLGMRREVRQDMRAANRDESSRHRLSMNELRAQQYRDRLGANLREKQGRNEINEKIRDDYNKALNAERLHKYSVHQQDRANYRIAERRETNEFFKNSRAEWDAFNGVAQQRTTGNAAADRFRANQARGPLKSDAYYEKAYERLLARDPQARAEQMKFNHDRELESMKRGLDLDLKFKAAMRDLQSGPPKRSPIDDIFKRHEAKLAQHSEEDGEFLAHYGVPGMQWGVRKSKEPAENEVPQEEAVAQSADEVKNAKKERVKKAVIIGAAAAATVVTAATVVAVANKSRRTAKDNSIVGMLNEAGEEKAVKLYNTANKR